MKTATAFPAEARETRGKGGARQLRREGRVPGVIYGKGFEPVTVSLPEKEVKREYLKGGFFNRIVALEMGGNTVNALPKTVELHPVTDRIEHIDFMKVDANSRIHVFVPVKFLNMDKSAGLKRGGVLNIVRHEVELVCSPDNIPSVIEIDIMERNIGDSIHISHVELPKDVTPAIKNRDFTIATIAGRTKEEEEVAPVAAAAGATAAPGAVPAAGAAAAPAKAAGKK